MLTRKQKDLLMLIYRHIEAEGVPPSFEEMKEELGLKSKSGIHRLISALEERGFVRRLKHRARALEVIRLPEDLSDAARLSQNSPFHQPAPVTPATTGQIVRPNFGARPRSLQSSTVQLPLYGKIAAGTPIEALRDNSTNVDIPAALIGRGDHYALEIEGRSMIEAGIFDGDTVIIRQQETAEPGDIVVALVDNQEATLKTFRRRGSSIALEPANAEYETRIYDASRVKIQGRLVALLRYY